MKEEVALALTFVTISDYFFLGLISSNPVLDICVSICAACLGA